LLVAEFVIRQFGAKPQVYSFSRDFKVVDSPFVMENFITDEAGIYKFSPWIRDSAMNHLKINRDTWFTFNILDKKLADIDKLDLVYNDFLKVTDSNYNPPIYLKMKSKGFEDPIESDLSKLFRKFLNKDPRNNWENSIVEYMRQPFNEEGFKSISFKTKDSTKKRVLIVGDSYVFGMYARPIHASFCDNLLAKGYLIFSAGIPGTDPAQYAAIAQKYVPILKPDLVVMCFYEGNDYMPYERTPLPNQPHEYISNAGFFQSAPYGEFLEFNSCYQYYKSLVTIPDTETKVFNRIMSKTVLSSLTWGLLLKFKLVNHPLVDETNRKLQILNQSQNSKFTARPIQLFQEACKKYNTACVFTFIPQRDDVTHEESEFVTPNLTKAKEVFGEIPFYVPSGLKREVHYGSRDNHFNTAGHALFSSFLDSLIRSNLSNQTQLEGPTE
jgi:hypothetical protein